MDFEITPEEVNALRNSGEDFVLLDVREPHEIATARIAGSVNIPMGDITARLQELDPEQHIVVVCHRGIRSANVAAWLQRQGFERVQSMRGGIDRWSREVDTSVPTY
ncbi:MAG TPA: rhodanese-like domain-containing protein [Terriglobales bacterium]|nr:rhodanese-like domain-containing protein [Terriglobales bacterium]